MTQLPSPEHRSILGGFALALAWLAMLLYAMPAPLIGDEAVHAPQIQLFLHGDFRVFDEWLTNVPGYHWLVTALLWPIGVDAIGWIRAVGGLFVLACLLVMYRIRQRLHPEDALRSTAQLFFLPVLLVYGWLAYTDVPALAFLLGALLATILGRHKLSAVLLLGSMAMRQNQVLWAAFLALYAAWPVLAASGWQSWRQWRKLAVIGWPYLACVAVFLGYWFWNGSISYSSAQAKAHPDLSWHVGNPFFLMVLAAMLFPFHMAAGWGRAIRRLRSGQGWLWLLVPLVVLFVYGWQFQVDHPYNRPMGVSLRNQWLQLVATDAWVRWGFGLAAAWASVGLLFARYVVPQGWLWLPFSLLFVGASWMIETRYTLVPFVLFLALRRPEAAWAERVTLAGWIVLSGWLAWNVFDLNFML
ncbi:MAG: hypothetical protein WCY72_00790 [Lysobacteraceae bacterium]